MRTAALMLLLFFASMAAAQQLPIVEEHTPISIEHAAGERIVVSYFDMSSKRHKFLDERHFHRGEGVTIWVAPPGNYVVYGGKEPTIVDILASDDDPPDPDPRPDPKPDPEPEPRPEPKPEPSPDPIKVSWAVWIYEQQEAANHIDETNTRQSAETREYLDSQGIRISAYEEEQDAAKPFLKSSPNLPALFLMQDAQTFEVFDAPENLEQLKAMVKEVQDGE